MHDVTHGGNTQFALASAKFAHTSPINLARGNVGIARPTIANRKDVTMSVHLYASLCQIFCQTSLCRLYVVHFNVATYSDECTVTEFSVHRVQK